MTDPDWPAPGARPSSAPDSINEATILDKWSRHIARVAGAVARGSHVDSGDLAQEARLRLLTVIRAFPEAPDQYVATVIVNAIRTANRRENRYRGDSLDDQQESHAQADTGDFDRALDVSAWVARQPVRLRRVYRHVYIEGRSQRETSEMMKVSQPRVAQLHSKLLATGRTALAYLAA
jgi:RNA polymerase sigma factor (sigma-70 family)